MEPIYPVKRKFKPDHILSLEDLRWARQAAAEMVLIEPALLPFFQIFDQEVIKFENQLSDLERAQQMAKNGQQFG